MSDIGIEIDIILSIVFFFAAIFLPKEWIDAAWNMNAASFVTFTVLAIAFGGCVGSIVRRILSRESKPSYFERKRIERENRKCEERERIEREENLRRLHRNWVLGFNANMKSFLCKLAKSENVEVPLNDDTARKLRNKLTFMGECAIECTQIGTVDGDECWSVRLNDLGKQVVEECSDILEETRDFKVQ